MPISPIIIPVYETAVDIRPGKPSVSLSGKKLEAYP
jgi:hypothetical protein